MIQTSNSLSFDCQDTGPNPTSKVPIKDSKDSEIGNPEVQVQECISHNSELNMEHEDSNGFFKKINQASNSPSFNCQNTGPGPTSQDPIKDTKDSEFGNPDVRECVNDNSESNLEHGYSSGGGALVDIVDTPPVKKIKFEISAAFASIILDFISDYEISEMAKKCDAGFGMNIVKFWDNLKRTMESEFKNNFRAASPHLSCATPGELANLNIEMEKVLQEILETFHKMNELLNKYRELFSYSLLGHGNSESSVEHGNSSGCGAHVDIVDAPPAKKIKFDISEAFVSIFRHFLEDGIIYDLAKQCEAGFGMNMVQFRDHLKQTMEWRLSHYFYRAASSQISLETPGLLAKISLETPGELANLNIEMELVLQEILETFHKMNGSVNKYGELFSYRMSGDHEEAKEGRNGEEYERLEEDDESSKGASMSPLPLFLEIIPFLLVPPTVFILFKILEHPIKSSFIAIVSCAIVSWLYSFLQ